MQYNSEYRQKLISSILETCWFYIIIKIFITESKLTLFDLLSNHFCFFGSFIYQVNSYLYTIWERAIYLLGVSYRENYPICNIQKMNFLSHSLFVYWRIFENYGKSFIWGEINYVGGGEKRIDAKYFRTERLSESKSENGSLKAENGLCLFQWKVRCKE